MWGTITAVLDAKVPNLVITRTATPDDAGEIMTVQRAAFVGEAQRYGQPDLPPLTESVDEIMDVIAEGRAIVFVAEAERESGRRIVGSGRLAVRDGVGSVGRLAVTPDLQGSGIGSKLLHAIHGSGVGVTAYELSTGAESANSLRWYAAHGYERVGFGADAVGVSLAFMRRPQLTWADGAPLPRVVCFVTRKGSSDVLVQESLNPPDTGTRVPAGGIEPGETVAGAAVRKVFEETGLDVRFQNLLGYAEHPAPDGTSWRTAYVHLDVEYAPDTWEHRSIGAEEVRDLRCRWAARDVELTGGAEQPLRWPIP